MLKKPIIYLNKKLNKLISSFHKELPKPVSIHISLTHKCNLKCAHCDIWQINEKRNEMTTDEIKIIITKLRNWLGPFNLNLAGGEPFIRKDIVDIIQHASNLGISITITSNGHFLNEEMVKKVEKAGLTGINISFDSLIPEVYDTLRGVKGGHKKALRAIELLKKTKIKVSLATIFMKPNLDELEQIIEFSEKNNLEGVNFQPIIQNFAQPYNPHWFNKSELWPTDYEKITKAVDNLIRLKKSGKKIHNPFHQLELFKIYFKDPLTHTGAPCLVGETNFAVNEYGEVLLCYFMKPVGNVIVDNPKKIWLSALAKKRREQINLCKRNCNLLNCNYS